MLKSMHFFQNYNLLNAEILLTLIKFYSSTSTDKLMSLIETLLIDDIIMHYLCLGQPSEHEMSG